MTNDDTAAEIAAFAGALYDAYVGSGRPSYELVARRGKISKSTVSRAFKGETLPRWYTVKAILEVCRVGPEDQEAWIARWAHVSRQTGPGGGVPRAGQASAAVGSTAAEAAVDHAVGKGCPRCGALVVDARRHDEFHEKYVLRATTGPRRGVLRPVRATGT